MSRSTPRAIAASLWRQGARVLVAASLLVFAPLTQAAPCAGFTDVDTSSAFCGNVAWLKNRSITLGCTSTTLYCPADNVSRLQMAAFMNRLGNALTPVQLAVDATPGAISLDASTVVCQTADFAAAGFARVAYANLRFSGNATAAVDLAADLVMSLDGGASWSNLNLFANRGFVPANRWGTLTDLGFATFDAAQSARFGVRMTRGGMAGATNLADSHCQLRVRVYGLDVSAPPVLKVLATSPNASEVGPAHGQFTIWRSGGDVSAPLVVPFALGGTAANCADYACIAGITIPAGQNALQVPVTVLQDTLAAETTETVTLTLVPDESIVIGSAGATVSIANGPAPTNLPPTVNAGSDQTITLPAQAQLAGSASDDSNPNPPATLTIAWIKVSGPGPVSFGDASLPATSASFSIAGAYVLRLTANDGALSAQDDVAITVNPVGGAVLLPGPPGDPANDHIPDIVIPSVTVGEVEDDERPGGTGLLTSRTRILVQFTDAATVADANTLLQSIAATIIGTMQDIKLVIVNIPDIGDFSGLDNALAVLRASPHVVLAVQDVALTVNVATVPSHLGAAMWGWNHPPSINAGVDGNWGLEAVRAPQMWNLNTFAMRHDVLRSSPLPRTGVLDVAFNDTAPPGGDGVNDHPWGDLPGLQTWIVNAGIIFTSLQLGASSSPGSTGHGQHVAGTIAAVFNDGFGVDGINPLAETHAADGHLIGLSAAPGGGGGVIGGWMFSIVNRDLRRMMSNWPDLRVVNISLGYNWYLNAICAPPRVDANNNANAQSTVRQHGIIQRRIFNLYPNTLFVPAAGNDSQLTGSALPIADCSADGINVPDTTNAASREVHAQWASPFNWAALGVAAGAPPPSSNVVIVEAVQGTGVVTTVPSYRWRHPKADFSNVGGTVSAPGVGILSTVGANMNTVLNMGHADYMSMQGTSMAAPHVTGLIGYLLHLDDTLTAQEVRSLVTGAAFTKTSVLLPGESLLPAGVLGPAPMIDAFAAMMGIDLLAGKPPLRIQRALVDVDDGTADGNTRADPFTGAINTTILGVGQRRGDGVVSIADFRAWRDAYLQTSQAEVAATGIAVALDGGPLHFKKDLNFDGCIAGSNVSPAHPVDVVMPAIGCAGSPLQNVYPRYDFNGDGQVGSWFTTAPFKVDPESADPDAPAGQNKMFAVRQAPGFLRDIDVMADSGLWFVTGENVGVVPAVEGLPAPANEWGPRRFLLGNRDGAIPGFKDVPDYLHSFDLHLKLDWAKINSNYEGVQIQVQSEMVAPYAQTFDRQITLAPGSQPPVVTLPIWTGKVKVTFTPVDNVPPIVVPTDPGHLTTTTKELTGVQFGEDRAIIHPRFPVVIDDIAPGRTNIGTDAAGTIFVAYERQVSSQSDGSEIRDHWFARSTDGGLTWNANPIFSGEQRRRDAMAIGGVNQVYLVHVLGNPSGPAPVGNASVQLIRTSNGGVNFSQSTISTPGTTNVDFHTDVATDAAGKVYVVWAESDNNPAAPQAKNPYMIRMRTSTNGGATFSAPVTIHSDPSPGAQWYPRGAQIAVTPNGQQIHVSWTDCIQTDGSGNCTLLSLRYSRSINGAAFTAPVQIAQNQFLTSFYDLAVDSVGNVSVVYPTGNATTSPVMYVRVENGATVRTVNASQTPFGFAAFAPRLAIDALDTPWITWFEGSATVNSDVYVKRTIDGGLTFSGLQNISSSASPSGASSIGPDQNGAPLITWGEQAALFQLWFRPVLSP